jgi:hypothetical protein
METQEAALAARIDVQAMMVLCCDPLAIALTAAASAGKRPHIYNPCEEGTYRPTELMQR